MTGEDADQLREWVDSLDTEQMGKLWHWLCLEYRGKIEREWNRQ